jgi:hypothetical protein
MDTPIADIKRLLDEYHMAYHGKSYRECAKLREPIEQLQKKAAKQFGIINGWKLTERGFSASHIGKAPMAWDGMTREHWFDHCLYYRSKETGRPAAIVTQPYNELKDYCEKLNAFVFTHKLEWHVAPKEKASIWSPGVTLFIVITMPEHKVKWLPDQE